MKKTYAYIKYISPKTNKWGSGDAGLAATCLGVTLNATEKGRYHYRQAEIEYPEQTYRVRETGGSRWLVPLADGEEVPVLNALLEAGVIRGRMFVDAGKTVEFSRLDDLTNGRPIPPDTGPEPPVCPHCRGQKTVTTFMDYLDRDLSGIRQIACPDCNGAGTVTTEYLERKAVGEAMREDRLLRDMSLRAEANRLGISPSELSRRERGQLLAEGEVTHMKGGTR